MQTLIKFSSSSVAAAIGFKLLNSDPRLHRPRRTRPTLRHGRHSSGTVRSRRGSQQTKLVTDCAGPNGEPQSPANGEKGSLSPAEDGLYDGMPTFLAGHNIDITLFAFVRALDSLFSSLKPESKKPTRRGSQSSFQMDAVLMLFIVCCGPIMKAWFYAPARLSPTLAAFITKVALLDPRILDALRKCRTGEWTYGSERIESLAAVCREEGIPERWGDPSQSIPLKKEWFECGIGLVERSPKLGVEGKGHVPSPFYQAVSKYVRGHASSEKHAALRFFQAWSFVFVRMLPLQLTVSTVRLVQLARKGASLGQYIKVLFNACWMTAKRSSVLGLFAGLIYYGVSLGRYRIGPRIIELMLKMRDMIYGEKLEGRGQPWFKLLFGQERVAGRIAYQAYLKKQLRQSTGKTTPEEKAEHFAAARRVEAAQMIDGGLAVTLGCWMSGLALLIEQPSRRVEMMLLAAPHAFGTLVPRRYDPKVSQLSVQQTLQPVRLRGRSLTTCIASVAGASHLHIQCGNHLDHI